MNYSKRPVFFIPLLSPSPWFFKRTMRNGMRERRRFPAVFSGNENAPASEKRAGVCAKQASAKRANINNRGCGSEERATEPAEKNKKNTSPQGANQPWDFLARLVRPFQGRMAWGGLSVGSIARSSRFHPRLFIFARFADIFACFADAFIRCHLK